MILRRKKNIRKRGSEGDKKGGRDKSILKKTVKMLIIYRFCLVK